MVSFLNWIAVNANAIIAIASAVGALSIVFVGIQTFLIRRQSLLISQQSSLIRQQIEDDHDRSRRETAINMLVQWSNGLQRESSSARKFVESLDEHQTCGLFDQKAMKVPKEFAAFIAPCLEGTNFSLNPEGDVIRLDEGSVSIIRWHTMRYLNALEAVMMAYRHHVADRDMISEQFKYLVDERVGHHALKRLRDVAGGKDAYPALEEFVADLKKSKTLPPGHKKLSPANES